MDQAPVISVVMPVYNAADTLAAVLASLANQDLKEWEMVAVDDGSTDESPYLLDQTARLDRRVRVLHKRHAGIVAALQVGCDVARGEMVARMDADDLMLPGRLQRQLQELRIHPEIGLVSCQVRYGGDATAQAGYAAHVAWLNSLLTPADIAVRRFVESPVAHPSVMFRRELLTRHGGYRAGDFPEDYELWLRWLEAGVLFGKVDAELLVWSDAPNRLSRRDARYRSEAFYALKCDYLARHLLTRLPAGREVWIWGAGRLTRRRFSRLLERGVTVRGYIDVDPKKTGRHRDGRMVVNPDEMPPADTAFIVVAVGTRGARELITEELRKRGRVEGEDYLLTA